MSGIDKTSGIWSVDTASRRHSFDPLLAGAIATLYAPMPIADLGCGLGWYCRALSALGWDIVKGYEGTPGIKTCAVYDDITTLDLSVKVIPPFKFDLVLCLEVGEHIPKEREKVFINNVVSFCEKHLVLSWAIPGQGGTGHFNERKNDYIINRIEEKGFIFNKKRTNFLRHHSNLRWFKYTLLVFERKS